MNIRTIAIGSVVFFIGALGGFWTSQRLNETNVRNMAIANIYATGESLRENDLYTAMIHANAIILYRPQAYVGYEAVADVYVRQGNKEGARTMYRIAIDKLTSGGVEAMMPGIAAGNVTTAEQIITKKLEQL